MQRILIKSVTEPSYTLYILSKLNIFCIKGQFTQAYLLVFNNEPRSLIKVH